MSRTILITFFIAFIGFNAAQAQPYHEPTYEQLLNAADESFQQHFYYNAIELYRECFDESRNDTLLYKIAESEYYLRDYQRAQRYYERIFRSIDPEEVLDYDVLFLYARTERSLGDYNKAYNIYETFLKLSSNDSLKQLAQSDIDGMIAASDYEERYDLYVTPLEEPVNSPFSEYAPDEAFDGSLYFTSFNRKSAIRFDKDGSASSKSKKGSKSDKDEDWYAHITRSMRGDEGAWEKPEELGDAINGLNFHSTNSSITPDGNYMYFNKQIISGQRVVNSKIMVSRNNGDSWGEAVEVEKINGDWLALHPTYGELYGREVIFFVADMPGSKGGLDIYYAPRNGEYSFGDPVNLGDKINTKGDEVTPFYDDGTLYFSSDGHPGMGGLDIFASQWDGSEWSEPQNMESGYNTRYDDFYFKTKGNEDKGYLVSNRPNPKMRSLKSESCCDDIYEIGIRDIEIDVLTAVFSNHDPLLDATVEVVETVDGKLTENSSSLKSPKGNTYRFPLKADKEYKIYAYKDGYNKDSTVLSTMDVVHSYTYKKQFNLEKTEPEMRTVTINEPIRLDNIYYDFDKANILPESEPSLNEIFKLMEQYKDMVIELSAHTDSRGNNAYNLNLSQRRAESAKNFLLNKGIADNRIIAKGYGETQILNGCVDGVECTEEEHQFNRRTEFKIIEGPKTIQVRKEILEGKKEKLKKGKLNQPQKKDSGFLDEMEKTLRPPILKFHETFYDFGVIKSGSPAQTEFIFTNTGEKSLKIEIATASNCQLEWPRTPINPGETGSIIVTFDSSGVAGEKEVTIGVIANSQPSVSEARFRAFVSP